MNTDKHFFRMGLLAVTLLVTASCGQKNSGDASLESTPENAPEIVLKISVPPCGRVQICK